MIIKEKIPGFNELAVVIKDYCLKLLANYYENGWCQLGNNGGEILSERESIYLARTSEFDDERVILVKRGNDSGFPYYLLIETNGDLNANFEIGLILDDLEDKLPKGMIEDLDEEFYKFFKNFKDD